MGYNEKLGERITGILARRKGATSKKMFGGLAFLLDGRMFCGIVGDDLMVRVGPDAYEAALKEAHVRPMDFTGRPMKGYVFVAPAGYRTGAALEKWVERSAAFVTSSAGTTRTKRPRRRNGPSRKARR